MIILNYSCTAVTVASSSVETTTVDITYPTGYLYLGITNISSNYSQVMPYKSSKTASTDYDCTVSVSVRNISSSSSYTATITIRVLYYKDF